MNIFTTTIGYPRIAKSREVKNELESFWRNKIMTEVLLQTVRKVETESYKTQLSARIDRIGIGDTTVDDWVLYCAGRLGLIPQILQGFMGLEGINATQK